MGTCTSFWEGHPSRFTQTLLLSFEPALELALDGSGSLDVPSPLACEICDDFVAERSEPFSERLFGTLSLSHELPVFLENFAFPQRP